VIVGPIFPAERAPGGWSVVRDQAGDGRPQTKVQVTRLEWVVPLRWFMS
jgi:hypothetical protein